MMYISYIFCLLSLIFLFKNFRETEHKFAKTISSLFFANLFLLISYSFANFLSGDGINDAIIFHIIFGIKGFGFDEYLTPIIILIVIFLALLYFFKFFLNNLISPNAKDRNFKKIAGVVFFIICIFSNPFYKDTYNLIFVKKSNSNIDVNSFYEQEIIFKNNKKNVIFLYLEQFERTYLNQEIFPGLAPNLSRLKNSSIDFTNIHSPKATNWTIAGMAASQCGVPLLTPIASENSMSGVDQFLPLARCIGDILNAENYELHYIGGSDLDFAGKGNFYETHNFNKVQGWYELEKILDDKSYRSPWGIYDDELLEIIFERIRELESKNNNYGLFALTLDTHHPYGYISKTCGDRVYQDGSNSILNSIHCVDYLIGEFVNEFINSEYYEDTILVLLSDHLALKNTASSILNKGNRTNLFMIFDKNTSGMEVDEIGNMFDIGPSVLGLIGTNTRGLGLGRNLLIEESLSKNNNIDDIINANKTKILELWSFPKLNDGFKISQETYKIYFDTRYIKYPALIILNNDNEINEIMFEFYYANPLSNKVNEINQELNFIWIDLCKKLNNYNNTGFIYKEDEYCILLANRKNKKFLIFSVDDKNIDNHFIKNYYQQ